MTPLDPPQDAGEVPGDDLFPTKLPISAAMALGLVLSVLVGATLVAAIVVPLPDTIRCPFVLMPEGGDDPVQAPRAGAVRDVLVTETQRVRKGQELVVIRSDEIRAWTSELQTLEQARDTASRRAELLEQDYRAGLDIQSTKIQQFDKDLGYQQEFVDTLRDFVARYEKLDAEGLVPRVDTMSQRLEASKAERDLVMTRKSRDLATLETGRLQTEHNRQVGEAELERRTMSVRMATLRKLLDGARDDVVRVTAPFDGTVVTVLRRPGDVVAAGQDLCRIARSDAPLIAELSPPEAGVARVRIGQNVQLFYEAFPYQRFGTSRGTVRWISPEAVPSTSGTRFVIRAALEGSPPGRPAAITVRAGMRGEARIVTGRRTLVEFVFEPLRMLRENVNAGS